MKDGKPNNGVERRSRPRNAADAADKRGAARRGSGPKRQRGFVERATASGHSGHGSESVRPHLRDQLKLKALLPQPFPTPPEMPRAGKDDHHR
jgi:hypothetical protein